MEVEELVTKNRKSEVPSESIAAAEVSGTRGNS